MTTLSVSRRQLQSTEEDEMHILVFQHLPVEHPGTLRDFWRERGHLSYTVELDAGDPIPKLEEFDLLVVMGGPQDVWQEDIHPWLVPEKEAIRRWVRDLRRPYLGICLGHQLLAEALDGRVGLMQRPEVGLANVELTSEGRHDPLFAGFDGPLETFQWHGAEIVDLPAGALALARNDACAVQAMRWGPHAYGLQYHVEITPETVRDWEAEPAYKASLEHALGPVEATRLNDIVSPRLAEFRSAAKRINDNFFSILADRVAVRPA